MDPIDDRPHGVEKRCGFLEEILDVAFDAAVIPSTTTREEFAAVTFATTHLDEPWTTVHKRTQVAIHYFDTSVTITPTATWLGDGTPPTCPVFSTITDTTTGAHFFPASPGTIDRPDYDRRLRTADLVYATTGTNRLSLTRPSIADGC